MACPISNTKEWIEFEENAGGQFQAHAQFLMNDFKIPGTVEYQKLSDDKVDEVESFIKYSKIREDLVFSLGKTIQANKISSGDDESFARLVELTKTLEEAGVSESTELIVNNGLAVIEKAAKRKIKNTDDLRKWKSYVDTFEGIGELEDFIEASDMENKEALLGKLGALTRKIGRFNKNYLKKGRRFLEDALAKESTFIRERERAVQKTIFQKNNPRSKWNGTNEDYSEKENEFVNNALSNMEDELRQRSKEHIRQQLDTATQDVGVIASWIDDPRGSQDLLIQLATKKLDDADFNVTQRFIAARKHLTEVHDKYNEKYGNKDQKVKYEGLIEKVDGEETGFMVAPVYNSVYEEYLSLYSTFHDGLIADSEKAKLTKEFVEKYIPEKFHAKYTAKPSLLYKVIGINSTSNKLAKYVKPEFKNPQFDKLSGDKKDMWTSLHDFNKASDKMNEGTKSLRYRLPGIVNHEIEVLREKGTVEYVKSTIKQATQLNENDTEAGLTEIGADGRLVVATDKNGDVIKRVHMPYVRPVDISKQSFDLVGMALAYRYSAVNFNEKSKIKADLEVLKDIMYDRDVKQTSDGNFLQTTYKNISKVLGGVDEVEVKDILKKGSKSNSYRLLEGIIEDRIYGVSSVDGGQFMGMDANKLTSGLMKWAGNIFLIGNVSAATSNTVQGKVMNFLEGVRGTHFNRKNLRKGEGLYWGDMSAVLNDIESRVPSSKTNLLREKFFTTAAEIESLTDVFVKDSKARRALSTSTLQGLNTSAEHYIQGTLMYAIMDGIEVNGMKLHEAYEVIDGKLKLKEGVKIDEKALSRKIKGVVADLHGNYDASNKAMVQRYWYGKLAMLLRKWLVRTVNRRWKGVSTTGKSLSEMIENEPHLVHFSEETASFTEGTHTSAMRFLRHNMKNMATLKLSLVGTNWESITDLERQNIKAAVTEMGVMALAVVSAALLAALAKGEDDDEFIYNLAYTQRRLYSELAFYVPTPLTGMEGIRVLQTPTTSLSLIELSFKALKQTMTAPTETFKSGRREGNNKALHYFNKLFNPAYRQMDNNYKEKYKFMVDGQ